MGLSIKAKQVAGVTSIVALAVIGLSLIHIASLARVGLEESYTRGQMLANAIYQRAHDVVAESDDPYTALREDPGIRSLLQSSIGYSRDVTYAAIIDSLGFGIAHSFPSQERQPLPMQGDLELLVQRGANAQLRAIYSDRTFEVRQPLMLGDERFGSIRIGISTLLVRHELQRAIQPALVTALLALTVAVIVAVLLAQWILRPMHVIRSGLTRLGRGEFDVTLDLPPDEEFNELGVSFKAISDRLSSVRDQRLGALPTDQVGRSLEDAVAIVNLAGEVVFANDAMRAALPAVISGQSLREGAETSHPYRSIIEATLRTRQSQGPSRVMIPAANPREAPEERLVATDVLGAGDQVLGIILVARNLSYLSQVQSTLRYSRKLAALGRLLAGVAHEVKNPLNAMTIHLELLKQKLRGAQLRPVSVPEPVGAAAMSDRGTGRQAENDSLIRDMPFASALRQDAASGLMKHVDIIEDEIRRLDQVMQDFLRFVRPGDLKLERIQVARVIEEGLRVLEPEVERYGIKLEVVCPPGLPEVNGDGPMLKQAVVNLALNACQAMIEGGTLRIRCRSAAGNRVEIEIEDTGTGIAPEHLEKIFDLYFTTKEAGSGIGLSLVYRIVQLHDGEIEVQSIVGRGTTFRILLPDADSQGGGS